jgi:hypothetical protein
MPNYKFFLPSLCFSITACIASQVQAADWRACEKAKLRQLSVEQAAHAGNRSSGKKSRSNSASKSRRSAEQIDEWLWKNCRDYSYELRNLEQQRM